MRIPRREELPEDFYELKSVAVELPRLSPDLPANCPVTMNEILEYLGQEAPGGAESGSQEVIEFQLEFLRTALIEATQYWIWRFADLEGTECYVTVALRPDRNTVTGYDESFGFTPEQFILADYYDLG
jgi:hypothetical protein